jgi:pyruvate formate lyase activating enzyme
MELLAPVLDAMNIDLKAFSNEFYRRICQAKLEPVLDTIRQANKLGIWIEITTLVIPGQNDSTGELTEIAEFIASVDQNIPWHISAFHPDFKMIDTPHTPFETLKRAYEIGIKSGLSYVYIGNVIDRERSSTYCPSCRKELIKRSGYEITVDPSFKHGICPHCTANIPGIWN